MLAASCCTEEVLGLELCVEYVGPSEAATSAVEQQQQEQEQQDPQRQGNGDSGANGAGRLLGRHAVVVLDVQLQPSLHVSQVVFKDLWLPAKVEAPEAAAAAAAAGAAGGDDSAGAGAAEHAPSSADVARAASTSFTRQCVMEVTVGSRGQWPLQVWLGPNVPDPTQLAGAAPGTSWALPPASSGVPGVPGTAMLLPGRRAVITQLLDAAPPPDATSSAAAAAAAMQPAGRGRVPTYEERQRTMCAERLAGLLALHYRVADGEDGEDLGGEAGTCECWAMLGSVHASTVDSSVQLVLDPLLLLQVRPCTAAWCRSQPATSSTASPPAA